MSEPSPDTEASIDIMSIAELKAEIEKGRYSRFANQNFAYLKVRLARLERKELETDRTANAQHKEESLDLNEQANRLMKQSNELSTRAFWVSIVALLFALISLASDIADKWLWNINAP